MELLKKSRAFLLLFVTFFFWGSVYVGGKLISDDVPAPLLGCLRCFVASFPLMLMARKHFGVKIDRADWKYFAGVGVMGYFLTIFLIQLGISLTGASMASLVNSVTPVGVTIFAALHLKEKITPTKVLCLVLALVGTFVITTGATGQGEMAGILVVLYLGLVGSGLAQYTWTASLAELPASTCSLFYPLQPMFSALLGMLLLNETFTPSFLVGLVLISADVILSTLETRKLAKQAQAGSDR